MQRTLDQNKIIEDFIEAVSVLQTRPESTGKVGAVGFCFGGSVCNQLAVRVPSLAASAPYYGGQPKAEDVPKIKAPLMIHYGGLDERVNAGWPAYEAALKANNMKYEEFVYAGANHGFHNDTTPRYDKAAAKLSWQRTSDFFNKNLAYRWGHELTQCEGCVVDGAKSVHPVAPLAPFAPLAPLAPSTNQPDRVMRAPRVCASITHAY